MKKINYLTILISLGNMSSRNRSDDREEIDASQKCQANPPIDTEYYPPTNTFRVCSWACSVNTIKSGLGEAKESTVCDEIFLGKIDEYCSKLADELWSKVFVIKIMLQKNLVNIYSKCFINIYYPFPDNRWIVANLFKSGYI